MISTKSLLLACAAPFAIAAAQAPAVALQQPLVVAQAPTQAPADKAAPDNQKRKPDDKQKPKAQTPPAAGKPAQPPAAQTKPAKPQPPAAQTKPVTPQAPAAQTKPVTPQAPAAQTKPATPPPAAAQTKPDATPPAAQAKPAAPASPAAAAPPPPTKTRDANEFLRRDNKKPGRGIADVRKERQETRDGNRVVIREGDRTIIRQDNRIIIQHNESSRFAVGARNVNVERRGPETITVVERPGGVRIITVTDAQGHVIRRIRRDASGRETVIFDNRFAGARIGFFIDLAPPVIRIPRERYIVEAWRTTPVIIYETFMAPPVERIDQRYTVEQVRFSEPLRARMPRVDLDVTFETGSWELSPEQVARLAAVADGLKRAIAKNPREVFMIEGHTDAVGEPEDNLSLSDRRAETVAVALSERFQVPAENLVTQGYGEQNLKVPTQGPERANRYVAVRRITPLIGQAQAENTGQR